MRAEMELPLKLYKKPRLKSPTLVAAWGCVGQVGIGAATYLRDKLRAEEFGEIEPYDFFDVPTPVKRGIIEPLVFPETKFYYWKDGKGADLIICMADYEPHHARYEYADLILELAVQFKIKKIYTICAFPTPIHHAAQPKVIGAVNDAKLLKYLEKHHIPPMDDRDLTSINALLLALARQREIQSIYLLSEVPSYAMEMANPRSSQAVLRVLTAMLGIDIDMREMEEMVRGTEGEMDKRMKESSREFLDHFTIDYRDLFERED
jgi:proteasome assembly chaperone (PAC2) family protein